MSEPPGTAASGRDGRSTRWDPHRRARRQAIVSAAVTAIERDGPDVLTSQVAELAGVPRTHVYRHFDGKAALDRAVSRQIATQLGERVRGALAGGGSPRRLIRGAVGEHLAWIEEHPNLYRYLALNAWQVGTAGIAARGDAKSVFAGELTVLLDAYLRVLGVADAPTEQLVVGIVGLVDATAAWWLDDRGVSRDELTDELTEQLWLLFERNNRTLGLTIDPDRPLPAP